jgi:hypothetical protein
MLGLLLHAALLPCSICCAVRVPVLDQRQSLLLVTFMGAEQVPCVSRS